MPPPSRLIVATVAACVALAACTPASPAATADAWPAPPPDRPQVSLDFTVAPDLASVEGSETVTFTPDLPVCELVFRAWPNKPHTARAGNSLMITSAEVEQQPVSPRVSAAGAPRGAPGSLIELPLPSCVPAGTPLTAKLDFSLRLGVGTDERVGRSGSGNLAWFGTAFPLLAWENGRGWARDDAVAVTGEMATSETFDLTSLTVSAPSQYAVLGVGTPESPRADPNTGLTIHRFSAAAVRDVTVTVGDMRVVERRVGHTTVHIGGPEAQLAMPLERWSDMLAQALTATSDYLGPVPYEHVWVSVIPDQSEGIEFPGAIQFGQLRGEQDRWLVTHEVAHLWFHGLVGNNQARHPWLDESFASFVQRVVDDPRRDPQPRHDYPDRVAHSVGGSMESWTAFRRSDSAYVNGVYLAGADMLIEARQAAGRDQFDAALRAYLTTNAHRIATPADVERAFADLPGAVDRLRESGALD
ncbi:M1 family aminopeptidase [Ammonicoccus fulvus]|uniref:M1 family aminopeptidase n=1 Tax=Ammonicoccus fulvus TaxID=3138240 RepID=A0ABZ3FTE8_9ACTN